MKRKNYSWLQSKARSLSLFVIVFVFLVSVFSPSVKDVFAQSLIQLQRQSRSIQKEIGEVNAEALALEEKARSLEEAIEELDEEIKDAQARIVAIGNEVERLQAELDVVQEELDAQSELLKANMRVLYKRSDISTVELLAASESFSEFIDEQEYLERVKTAVQESAQKIMDIRLEIQAQQRAQQELLDEQEAIRESLKEARQEREELLDDTLSEEDRLREYSETLNQRQRGINQQLLRLSRVVTVGGTGGYPWGEAICAYTGLKDGACRHPDDNLGDYEWYISDTSNRRDPWGYFFRNCTSYVAWKSAQYGFELDLDGPNRRSLGDGGAWEDNASKYPELTIGSEPKVGAYAVFNYGTFGHVAFVEKVNGNEVLISEYNFVSDGEYSERWISKHQPTGYVYPPYVR